MIYWCNMELSEFLSTINLSDYERRAIVALASKEHATATQIVKFAGIPQGRVYDVLTSLHTKGIVEIVPTRPQRFLIHDVKLSLQRLLQIQQLDLKNKMSSLSHLKIMQQGVGLQIPTSVSFYTSRIEHLQALIKMRDNSHKELLQMAPIFIGDIVSNRAIHSALSRGVKVRVITLSVNPENKAIIHTVVRKGAQVRTLSVEHLPSFCISDKRELLFGVNDYTMKEDRLYVLTKNHSMLLIFSEHFETYWAKAKPVKI